MVRPWHSVSALLLLCGVPAACTSDTRGEVPAESRLNEMTLMSISSTSLADQESTDVRDAFECGDVGGDRERQSWSFRFPEMSEFDSLGALSELGELWESEAPGWSEEEFAVERMESIVDPQAGTPGVTMTIDGFIVGATFLGERGLSLSGTTPCA